MKRIFYSFLCLSLAFPAISSTVFASSKPIAKEDVIIMFKKKADSQLVQNQGGVIDNKYKNIPAISASVPVSTLSSLKKNPKVAYVEVDKSVKPTSQIVDWGIGTTKSDVAKTNGFTGKGVKIAVLDTGIKSNHPDLFVSGGYNPTGASTEDTYGHGTHVAGIISAEDNDIGIVGDAPDSQVYAVKVMNNSDGSGSVSDIIQGIDWSISNHMNIINMSLGSNSYSQAFQDAVNRAHDAGIFVVAAAGNDGDAYGTTDTVDYPAKYDNVIAVAAVDNQNHKASFSSAGPAVDFAAPGVNILSTYINGSYVTMCGTSMAAPFVSGIVALYKEAYPNYTNDQIMNLMEINAIDLGNIGKDNLYGYGLVQAPIQGDSSLLNVPIPSIPTNFHASDISSNSINLSWDNDSNAKIFDVKRNGILVYSGSLSTFMDKGLLANTSYQYELKAKNVAGVSSPVLLTVKTKSLSLSFPHIYTSKTTSGYKFYWYKVTNATNYRLYRTLIHDGVEDSVLVYNGASLSYFEDNSNLVSGTTYTYKLMAENDTSESLFYRMPFTTSPDAVTGFTETHSSTSANLSWNASKGATYYQLKVNGKIIYTGNATKFVYNGLLANTSYAFSVVAGNNGGVSPSVSVSFITPQVIPASPSSLLASGTVNSATLKWGSIYNASGYHVYRDGNLIATVTTPTFADSGLIAGTTYSYSVGAFNELGESPLKTISFTTVPLSPSGLNAEPTQNSVSLSWNGVQGATYYLVKRNGIVVYKGANTSYVNVSLTNNTSYVYTVQAGNAAGLNSSYVSVSTKTLPPITSNLTISTNSSYQAGAIVPIVISLNDNSGIAIPGQTLSIKIVYPNATYHLYSYKTDSNGQIQLSLYTNLYTMRGNYQVQVTKSYTSRDVYTGATASKTFSIQ